jgi:hypothetical protein
VPKDTVIEWVGGTERWETPISTTGIGSQPRVEIPITLADITVDLSWLLLDQPIAGLYQASKPLPAAQETWVLPREFKPESEIKRLREKMQELEEEVEWLREAESQEHALLESLARELAPVKVTVVDDGQTHLTARKPLVLRPNAPEGIIEFSHPRLGILSHSAESYAEAKAGIVPNIAWLWRSYAMADDSELSLDATELKHALLDMFRES